MVKHNNDIPNIHLRKHWINRVKTHFDQPAKKKTRSMRRANKAARIFPRPIKSLRPIVSSATRRYAGKVRLGRGFTLAELKNAGLNADFARSVGICVDHRRSSSSQEQFDMNTNRLKEYKSKMILFPRRDNKPKKGMMNDATAETIKSAAASTQATGTVMPLSHAAPEIKMIKMADYKNDAKKGVFHTLRTIRTNTRYKGRRDKKAADAEEAKK
jgi:large subunit ribosomal protein L13e